MEACLKILKKQAQAHLVVCEILLKSTGPSPWLIGSSANLQQKLLHGQTHTSLESWYTALPRNLLLHKGSWLERSIHSEFQKQENIISLFAGQIKSYVVIQETFQNLVQHNILDE